MYIGTIRHQSFTYWYDRCLTPWSACPPHADHKGEVPSPLDHQALRLVIVFNI